MGSPRFAAGVAAFAQATAVPIVQRRSETKIRHLLHSLLSEIQE